MKLICTPCGNGIGPRQKYLAITITPQGYEARVYCEHSPEPPPKDAILLASAGCAMQWFSEWNQRLMRCEHETTTVHA